MTKRVLCGAVIAAVVLACAATSQASPVTSGLVLWLDANDLDGDGSAEGTGESGLTGSAVNTWDDKSTNDNDVTQATATNQPAYDTAGGLNGKPLVRFDGTDDHLFRTDALGITGNPAITVFIVATNVTDGGTQDIRFVQLGGDGSVDPSGKTIAFSNDSSWRFNNGNRVFANDPMDDGSPHIGVWRVAAGLDYDVAGREFFLDSNTPATRTDGAMNGSLDAPNEATSVGGKWVKNYGSLASPTEFLPGDIAEILIYNRKLNDTEMTQVGLYLGDKWGVNYVPEPATLGLLVLGGGVLLVRRRRSCRRP